MLSQYPERRLPQKGNQTSTMTVLPQGKTVVNGPGGFIKTTVGRSSATIQTERQRFNAKGQPETVKAIVTLQLSKPFIWDTGLERKLAKLATKLLTTGIDMTEAPPAEEPVVPLLVKHPASIPTPRWKKKLTMIREASENRVR